MRNWCSRRRASSWLTPSRTVISRSLVISSETGCSGLAAKRTSRLVRMPTSLPLWPCGPRSTTGMPEIELCFMIASASASVSSGKIVIGLATMPDSNFLTRRTCAGLLVGLEIAVDDAEAAGLRHGDRHPRFGHRIHRRGDDRHVERDGLGQLRADIDLGRQHVGRAGLEQHVVEGQAVADQAVSVECHRQLRGRACGQF